MIENIPVNATQHPCFNANINVNLNNGTAATALFVVLGVCCCVYIITKCNYTATINNSLSIGPTTTAVRV